MRWVKYGFEIKFYWADIYEGPYYDLVILTGFWMPVNNGVLNIVTVEKRLDKGLPFVLQYTQRYEVHKMTVPAIKEQL